MKFLVLFWAMTGSVAFFGHQANASSLYELRTMPVQDGGRVKPFETFAQETLRLVYGRSKFAAKGGEKKAAVVVVFSWILLPEHWGQIPIIEIDRPDLKTGLKLDVSRKYFTANEVTASDRLPLILQELAGKRQIKAKLNPFDTAVQRLESQISVLQGIRAGVLVRVVPPKEGQNWLAVSQLQVELRDKFLNISRGFTEYIKAEDTEALNESVREFKAAALLENPNLYSHERKLAVEVHYNTFNPFQWAWMIYLLAVLACGFGWIGKMEGAFKWAWMFWILGFVVHTYAFGLRVYIAGRPPVSNMYESVVWVSWGVVLFGMILEKIYKKRYVLFASSFVATFSLIVAGLAPTILDASLQPLEPVLRSNLWLIIHVMTITLSYAAFFLAMGLADMGLIQVLRGKDPKRIKELSSMVYRVIQIGVVLIAAGTILGGVWADYSWGRFWGWDPKETWALIVLLGYLGLLHARKGGYIRDFGLMIGSTMAFALVVMAWYGVNYVLGAGLHSYGFGGGGFPFVASFVTVQFVFSGFAYSVMRGRAKQFAIEKPV